MGRALPISPGWGPRSRTQGFELALLRHQHELNSIKHYFNNELEKEKCNKHLLKRHFTFDVFLFISICLLGTFGLHFEATGNWPTNLGSFQVSPYIFVHQILPARIWAQSDMCLLIDCTAVLAMLATFSFLVPPFPLQGQLFFNATTKQYVLNTKQLGQNESTSVAKLAKKANRLILPCSVLTTFSYTTFCLANVYLSEKYQITVLSLLFWSILFPLFLFYFIYSK